MSTLNVATAKVTNYQDASGNPVTPARAWVNFNGTGTVAIRAANNVSSITDNGVGDYTVNFSNPLPDSNYAAICTSGASANGWGIRTADELTPRSVSLLRVITLFTGSSFSNNDSPNVNVAIFR